MEIVSQMLAKINWVDILIVLVSVRIIYVGIKNGFIMELFKLGGVVFAIFISFHYYTKLSQILQNHSGISHGTADFLCFGFLWGVVVLIFKFIREGLMLVFKVEALSLVDQWGGLLLSIIRGALTGSLVLVFLQVSGVEYWKNHARKSFFSPYLAQLSPKCYEAAYERIVSKFFPTEKLNPAVLKLKSETKDPKRSTQ